LNKKVVIIGDGAMGTVCGLILAENTFAVTLWSHSQEQSDNLKTFRKNRLFLPGITLPDSMQFSSCDTDIFQEAEFAVSAVPCAFLRSVWQRLSPHLPSGLPILSITKGIENNSLARPSEIIGVSTKSENLATFSGPNIADELTRKLPATSTVASLDENLARKFQQAFNTHWLRVYTNSDMIGVELAGATKNVIAIAAGIIDGLGSGDNAKAALLTRGLVEITRLGVAMGAQQETFIGLSGMGDLVTTCVSPKGRNRTFGQMLAQGKSVAQVLAEIPGQVEGVNTCRSLVELKEKHKVDMPITQAVADILFNEKPVTQAITELLSRPLKAESTL